jgi:hypothetical protein
MKDRETIVHIVQNADGTWIGEDGKRVASPMFAFIWSRDGAVSVAGTVKGQAFTFNYASQSLRRIRTDARICQSCGSVKPIGQSCICFDNGCQ